MGSSTTIPFSVKHVTLLNREPSERQLDIYKTFPDFRGISDTSLNKDILDVILVMGLLDGTYKDRVFLLAPPDYEAWVLQQLEEFADTVFQGAKRYPNASRIAQGYGILFKKLALASRVLQFPSEPEHWVSFGFSVDTPIPDWMRAKLVA